MPTTCRLVEKMNRTYILEPATQSPIWKGRAKRAIETALKHLGYGDSLELLISAREGSTKNDKGYSVYVSGDYEHCAKCWIVQVSRRDPGLLDGPYSVIWVDQKTGKVVKSGGGSGG